MRRWWLNLAVVPAIAFAVTTAQAEDKKGSDSETKSETPKKSEGKKAKKSAYAEAINAGNNAYGSKDFAKAAESYQEAVTKEPKKPLGYYLLGEAQIAAGKLDDADKAYQSALQHANSDPVMKSKVLFVIADLRERQGKWDDAITAWKEYQTFIGSSPAAKGYPGTPTARITVVETHKDLEAKYAKVKERIAQRLQETSNPPPAATTTPPKK